MKQMFSPEPIEVDVPDFRSESSNHHVEMTTWLYREGCFLPEALSFAVSRANDPMNPVIASAACSDGSEVDSLLSLHRRGNYEGSLTARGYDINQLALEAARQGVHRVYAPHSDVQIQQRCSLRHMGFETSPAPGDKTTGVFMDVDAAPVRDGHTVEFAEHDLLEPFPAPEPADLVLANNVLYHLSPKEAVRVLRHLCDTLADNGVISLGSVTMHHSWWRKEMVTVMDEEYGLEPIFGGGGPVLRRNSIPVIFGRA